MTALRLRIRDAFTSAFSRKILDVSFLVSASIVLLRLGAFVIREPFYEGDTKILLNEHITAIRKCLSEGRFSQCPDSGVWPLFQHLPSLALSYLGFSSTSILHVLAYISFIAFLSSVTLVFWTLQKKASRAAAITGVLIMSTSPLLWYSHSTFAEMTSAFLILAFTCACLTRAPWGMTAVLFVLSGWTKEIAFPFLLMIGALCLFYTPATKRKKQILALGLGTAITMISSAAFNYFRYGTFVNASYASRLFIVPTFKLQLSFFLGIWLSPNGGLLLFWPSFVLVYFGIVAAVLLEFIGSRTLGTNGTAKRISFFIPLITISIILFALTAGFARWFTPLGGAAWGPRYMIPWIPAVVVLLLYFYGAHVLAMLRPILKRSIAFALASISLIAVSLPQFAVMYGHYVLARIFGFPECARIPIIQADFESYYPCIQTQIWPRTMVITELYSVAVKPPALWFTICYCFTIVGGLWWLRRQLAQRENISESLLLTNWAAFNSRLRNATDTPLVHSLLVISLYSLIFVAFFFPALYLGNLLAVGGDGLYIYLPNFYSHKVLWDTFIFSGFPMMADPQVMTWYPPALFLSLIPHSWNVFMLLGYVAGASFMYGYVHTLTESRPAAFISGLVFGLSGFMIAHFGHAVIVHAAAWIPLTIWSLEKLRRSFTIKWFVIGSIAISLSFFGGHSQIFFYGLVLSIAYAITVGWTATIGWRRFFLFAGLMIFLGLALSAVQFIPTAELARQGGRATLSLGDFVSFSLPPRQALTLIFPNVFGNIVESGALPYFGAENRTELVGYVGLLPLLLAGLGLFGSEQKIVPLFWTGVAMLAFLFAMGDATPLARVIYHVPILNGFRAPSRTFLESTIAISTLLGLGIAAIIDKRISKTQLCRALVIAGVAMFVFLVLLFMNSSYMSALAERQNIHLTLRPWANRAVATPLIIFAVSIGVLVYWRAQPRSTPRLILLVLILVIDLGSFDWYHDWRYFPSDVTALNPPEFAIRYRNLLDRTRQRLIPYRSARGTLAEMPPNLTRLWGVPSAGGYNVLVLSRISNLLPMIDHTDTPLPWTTPEDKTPDLLAIRYLFLPQIQVETDSQGISWSRERMQQWLGEGCGQAPRNTLKFTLPNAYKSTSLAIVSRLACSSQVPDQTRLARVQLIDSGGNIQSRELLAGRDSSEWAADCGEVKAHLQHGLAKIYSNYPARMYDQPCQGHFYLTNVSWNAPKEIKQIQVDWEASTPTSIVIEKMTLVNNENGSSLAIDSAAASENWRLFEQTDKTRVYENLQARPRVWLVSDIEKVTEQEALQAVKTGQLKDGRSFDPARTALVEGAETSSRNEPDKQASATIMDLRDSRMVVRTTSSQAAFLLTSDSFYPGWRASIDGQPTTVHRADYAIRGVVIPAGEHVVRFEYRPRSFYVGAIISVLSVVALVLMAAFASIRSSKSKVKKT